MYRLPLPAPSLTVRGSCASVRFVSAIRTHFPPVSIFREWCHIRLVAWFSRRWLCVGFFVRTPPWSSGSVWRDPSTLQCGAPSKWLTLAPPCSKRHCRSIRHADDSSTTATMSHGLAKSVNRPECARTSLQVI